MFCSFTSLVSMRLSSCRLKLILAASALTFCPWLSHAQTVSPMPVDVATIGQGTLAPSSPLGALVDPSTGTVYIMDSSVYKVWTYNPATGFNPTPWLTTTGTGASTPCTGGADFYGDGCPLSVAWDIRPYGMAIDSLGNIYIGENAHSEIHVVIGPNGAGTVLTALLTALGVSPNGTTYQPGYMYLVAGGGKETTADAAAGYYCGTGTATAPTTGSQAKPVNSLGDGCLATAVHSFANSSPRGLGVDGYGNIYIDGYEDYAVRMVVANPMTITGNPVAGVLPVGTITTIAGLGPIGGYTGTPGAAGNFCSGTAGPTMTDAAGDGCLGNQVAMGGTSSAYPWGLSADRFGNVYITDSYQLEGKAGATTTNTQGLVRKLTPSTPPVAGATVSYTITDIAGLPPGLNTSLCANAYDAVGDGCPATQATLNQPRGVSLDPAGNVYFSDYSNNLTRRIDAATGIITNVAGAYGVGKSPTGNCATANGTAVTTSPIPTDAYGAGCLGNEIWIHQPQGQPGADGKGNVYAISSSNGYLSRLSFPAFPATATTASATMGAGIIFANGDTPAAASPFATNSTEFSVNPLVCVNTANSGGALAGVSSNATVCHLSTTFSPKLPGNRNAALLVTDTATPAATSNFSLIGTGTGAGIGLDPASTVTRGSGWKAPTGIATDASANLYVADANNSLVVRIAGSNMTTVASGLNIPGPVAVAANGNVYVADKTSLYMVPASGSGYGTASVMSSVVSAPQGLALDGSGNLFVADSGHSQILEFPNSNGAPSAVTSFALSISGVTLNNPTAAAVDASGNLFIANAGASQIVELPANSTSASVVANGLAALTALTADAAGNIYYAQSNGTVGVVYAGTTSAVTLYANAARVASGIAVDGSGNLYVTDSSTPAVTEFLRAASSLSFGSLAVYTTSPAQTVTASSTGNANLSLTSAAQTNSTDFSIAPATANGCVYGQAYAPGTFCAYTATFSPTNNIALSDVVSLTTNAANSSTSTITATGTGTGSVKPRAAIALSSSPASPAYGQTVTATAAVTPASGTGTPTGTVTFSIDGGTAVAQTLAAGVAAYPINGLIAGTHTITANYAGDTNFGSAPQMQISVTVTKATPVVSWTPTAGTQAYGTAISSATLNATINNGIAGSMTYTAQMGAASPIPLSAGSTILTVGSYTLTAMFTPTDTADYTSASSTVTYTVTQATPVISWTPSATSQIYGTAIGSGVLNASITGTEGGSLSYSAKPASGSPLSITATSVLGVGSYVITVTFTPTDTVDYTTASLTSPYTVTQATPVITWLPASGTQAYGTAIGTAVLDASVASPQGTITYTSKLSTGSPVTLTAATILNTGSYTLTVTFTPADTADYATATATQSYVVTKALPVVMLSTGSSSVAVNTVSVITATVTLGGATVANTGQVRFYDGVTLLGSAQIVGTAPASGQTTGTALIRTRLNRGTHSITAVYTGPYMNFQSATSSALAISVTGTTASTTQLTAVADPSNPQNYDFTGTVSGYGPTAPSAALKLNDITAGNTTAGSMVLASAHTVFAALTPGFSTGSAPAAILGADFDNDGLTDFAIANSASNSITVVLGSSLAAPVTKTTSVGATPRALAVGDFNGDGLLDLAVVNQGDNTVGILLGKGDGTFQPMVTYPVGRGPSSIAVADFNQDGSLDLAVANSTDGTVSILNGNGNGTFAAAVNYAVGSAPASIAGGNLGNSAAPSVVTANSSSNTVSVLLNPANGTGSLAAQVTYATGKTPLSAALADVNGDGNLDIIVANNTDMNVGVLGGNANGTFNPMTTTPVAAAPVQVQAADLNGDGANDVAVATSAGVTVLYGKGDGTFPATGTATATSATALAAVDVNGDGASDLAVLTAGTTSVSFYANTTVVSGQLLNTAVTGTGLHQVNAIYPGDSNYAGSSSTALTVTARTVTTPVITWTPSALTQSYSAAIGAGVLNAATVGNIPGSFIYTARLGAGTPATITPSTVLTAGVYTITASFTPVDQTAYNTASANITYTVAQIVPVLSWTPSATAQTYGAAIGAGVLDATVSGTQPGVITYSAKPTSTAFAITATSILPASTYVLTATYTPADTTDYQTVTQTQAFTVNPAVLTVTAQAVGKAYGATMPTLTSVITGYVNGESSSVLTGSAAITTTATQNSQAGTYPISAAIGSLAASNYTFTFVPATFTITPVTLTITVNNATKVYGAGLPLLSGNAAGTVNGDVIGSNVLVVYSTTATATSGAGRYAITASVSGSSAASYTPVISAGTLTITPAPATITPANATSIYGSALPAFSGTITGAINGDTLTAAYSTTATAASPIGTYPISGSLTGASAANYSATVVPGTLTVMAANLTVTINNATKQFGAALPTFSASAAGLVNGDTLGGTIVVSYSTTATVASGIGSYPITGTLSGTSLNNYTATVVPGSLTVTTAASTTTLSATGTTVASGTSVTFTAAVSSTATGTPSGTVSFLNGATVLGSGTLTAGVATYTTTALPNGYDSVTAVYSGDRTFAASASAALVIGVATTPDFSVIAVPGPSLTVASGGVGTLTLEALPVNGYTGTLSLSCGTLPQYVSCAFSPSKLIATGTNTPLYSTLTITAVQLSALRPAQNPSAPIRAGLLVWPAGMGLLLLCIRRRALARHYTLRALCGGLMMLGVLTCLSGCGTAPQSGNDAAPTGSTPATFTVTVADGAGISHPLTLSLTIQ